ncbi:MAG: ATP-binding region, ATPase-like:Histidine kinase N-terminal [Proteobacteria bacterium]|nr:ATP-binding region, ATPase-like:Histidine kinase N-terminal [Pseudomonadota bacterium]
MPARKPETLALSIALAGTLVVLLVFLADLVLARHRDLESGERRIQHFGLMMAEHTARTFEAVDVLLRETATDLSHSRRDWETWDASKGWEYIAQRHSRAMPQLRDLIIFDRLGNQRFISTFFPAPHINVRDRPYFNALEGGAESASFGPYIGRNSGRYTYAIARRLTGDNGQFSGAVFAAMEPAYLQDFCWSNRLSDDFETVLINQKSEIIASCRPADLSRQSPVLGAQAATALYNGQLRGLIPESGLTSGNGYLIAVSQVPGFPDLRILSVIPEKTLLAAWQNRLFELGTLALLVSIVLLVTGLLVRRQVREMAAMTTELAASHNHLEERVHEATQELAGQKNAAERANAAKSRFLAAASHDLRQPLHALSLFATDLQRQIRSGTPQELPRLAEQISASTTILGELLDSLLDISRLDVAGIKPDSRPSPLQPMFDRLANSFRRAATDRNMTLRFRPSKLWVESDPIMLERMIANLVSNALRYTPPGGSVLVVARNRGDRVKIEIRDNGIGIASEHQAAIFAEFYQIGNTAREQNKGLGLGLSIVDRLAKALGIEVALNSRQGEGTKFSLSVASSQPVIATTATSDKSPPAGKVHCIGTSEEMQACIELMERWDYAVSADDGSRTERRPEDAVLIAEPELAAVASAELAAGMPLVILVRDPALELPAGAHALPVPVRPAKLRALLNQLQKTLSKSTP